MLLLRPQKNPPPTDRVFLYTIYFPVFKLDNILLAILNSPNIFIALSTPIIRTQRRL